jgi:hypothetical protein
LVYGSFETTGNDQIIWADGIFHLHGCPIRLMMIADAGWLCLALHVTA